FDDQETARTPTTSSDTSSDKGLKGSEGGNWLFTGFNRKKQDPYIEESTTVPTATSVPPSYSDVSSSALRELKQREEEIAMKEADLLNRESNIEAGTLRP
ncbi:hypothetical protein, partial [Salmonella sp. s51228]|uniref:hypothetical protein n=1 Tax=Salmonella sp. s51228 TaxID=3159652 RepID=UPI0039813A42